jgi:hypothetical protein
MHQDGEYREDEINPVERENQNLFLHAWKIHFLQSGVRSSLTSLVKFSPENLKFKILSALTKFSLRCTILVTRLSCYSRK